MSLNTQLAETSPATGSLDGMQPILNVVGMLMLFFSIIMMVKFIFDRQRGDTYTSIFPAIMLFGISGAVIFMPTILNFVTGLATSVVSDPEETGSPSPSPTVTPTPSTKPTTPPVESAPMNFEIIWLIIAGVAALALLALAGYFVTRSAKGSLEKRREREAIRQDFVDRWQRFIDSHEDLKRKVYHAETDWDTLFSMPALSDVSVPETAAMFRAMQVAGEISSEPPVDTPEGGSVAGLDYPKAVSEFARTWNVAYRTAQRLGQSVIPEEERKIISEIRTLLKLAESQNEAERQLAYKRIKSLTKKLHSVTIPEVAMDVLEARVLQAIEA